MLCSGDYINNTGIYEIVNEIVKIKVVIKHVHMAPFINILHSHISLFLSKKQPVQKCHQDEITCKISPKSSFLVLSNVILFILCVHCFVKSPPHPHVHILHHVKKAFGIFVCPVLQLVACWFVILLSSPQTPPC